MNKSTNDKIIDYISKNGQASGKELTEYLNTIGGRAVRKQLKKLYENQILQKIGKPPRVYYLLSSGKKVESQVTVNKTIKKIIDQRYLYISPTGEQIEGWLGFLEWCNKTDQSPIKTAGEYITTLKKYDRFRKNDLIDGMQKMQRTFEKVYLDKLFYLDFYSIERFGKTKLGQILLYAKQSQNIKLINSLINEIRPKISTIIHKYKIDGVIFIPPSVKREVQLMKQLEDKLRLPIRKLIVSKIKTEIIIPQKTLSKLNDRIENARRTIIVGESLHYNNILIIDDAVGSGATLNETAKQIKNKNMVSDMIIGLAITGSYKGFDVISEV